MYVIQRDDGQYVARLCEESSYTRLFAKVRVFRTLAAAQQECCPQNERIVKI